ncbi:MAG: methylated-DNA-[protein]-cysteine S-methyltransferase [Halioglobus sp.]|jgi:methylated-DNA-[protein]-cysteine S-methyltransferase
MKSKLNTHCHYQLLDTPIGTLRLVSDGVALTKIEFPHQHTIASGETETTDPALLACAVQLIEYFAGERKTFKLPLNAGGTIFQIEVWSALADIPFGELRSYSDIAIAIDRPKAVRAVGAANGRNPLPIIVPCHRVIGSNGSLTGFAGGIPLKTKLLELEGALLL